MKNSILRVLLPLSFASCQQSFIVVSEDGSPIKNPIVDIDLDGPKTMGFVPFLLANFGEPHLCIGDGQGKVTFSDRWEANGRLGVLENYTIRVISPDGQYTGEVPSIYEDPQRKGFPQKIILKKQPLSRNDRQMWTLSAQHYKKSQKNITNIKTPAFLQFQSTIDSWNNKPGNLAFEQHICSSPKKHTEYSVSDYARQRYFPTWVVNLLPEYGKEKILHMQDIYGGSIKIIYWDRYNRAYSRIDQPPIYQMQQQENK